MAKTHIASAGNTEVPAYLALIRKGYSVRRERSADDEELWFAAISGCEFIGNGPLELLGIVCMYETRGEHWKATDQEIEEFLAKYEI